MLKDSSLAHHSEFSEVKPDRKLRRDRDRPIIQLVIVDLQAYVLDIEMAEHPACFASSLTTRTLQNSYQSTGLDVTHDLRVQFGLARRS